MACERAFGGSIGSCKNVPRPFFDCALSKYSSLLSAALHFQPFQGAVYFCTRINERELKNRITAFALREGLKHTVAEHKATRSRKKADKLFNLASCHGEETDEIFGPTCTWRTRCKGRKDSRPENKCKSAKTRKTS